MTEPRERIEGELREAMKAGDKTRVATLRLLLNDITNEQIRAGSPVDEAGFIRIVRKGIKQRREATEQYRKGGRPELADQEDAEAELLEKYLPPAISEDEIRTAIRAVIAEQNLTAPAGMGALMKVVMGRYAGRVDGSVVQRLARELLPAGS